jgi:hypothetical protein
MGHGPDRAAAGVGVRLPWLWQRLLRLLQLLLRRLRQVMRQRMRKSGIQQLRGCYP